MHIDSIRLNAIEASLAEIKELLKSQFNTATSTVQHIGNEKRGDVEGDDTPPESENTPSIFPDNEPTDRVAPIKVVRELNNIINGPVELNSNDHIIEQLSEIGLASTELTTALYRGFEQVASRSPFIGNHDPTALRDDHPLLFAVCLLIGVRTIPGLNGSELHGTLHTLTKNSLGVKMLNTPLELSGIHAMLAVSTWNISPLLQDRYIDSWLLSGTTITQCMLSVNLSALACLTDFRGKQAREKTRTWNLASLVHLKYSIGTGRPSVVEPEHVQHWAEIAKYPGFDDFDRQTASETKLYLLLYNAVFRNSYTVADVWGGIEDWRRVHLKEGNDVLEFAYSCVTLITARWELTKLHGHIDTSDSNPRTATLINTATQHAQLLLMKVMTLCATTACVKTTYDLLLSAYAALTLVEYSSSLPDLQATYQLMENVQTQSKIAKMVESVFAWATGMMRKRAGDQRKETERMAVHRVMQEQEPSSDWIPSLLVDSVDPTLLGPTSYYETSNLNGIKY